MVYKAVDPVDTIERIEHIINALGIKLHKVYFGKHGITNSVRVDMLIDEVTCLSVGTNGKGMDSNYALASAYGEFMERLQNKMLYFTTKYSSKQFILYNNSLSDSSNPVLDFRYFPDEIFKTISDEELCFWGNKLLPFSTLFQTPVTTKLYDMPFLEFYNAMSDEIENLPYDLIRFASGSTGLCAGNTPQEAIVQGLNEIFERYVLQRIYIDKPILPTIHEDYFSGTSIFNRIEEVRNLKGWKFIIKDCSLNMGFPVIGLLIIDDKNSQYTFRLGADLSPVIALQRCFTEIFQGTDISDSIFIPFDVSEKWDIPNEYNNNVVNGRGKFPSCIFLNESSVNKFDTSLFPEYIDSIDGCFKSIFSWLQNHGYIVYIRDNSFLGFPSFHIYIPGLSDVDSRLFDIRSVLLERDEYYKIPCEYRLKHLSKNDAQNLIDKFIKTKQEVIQLFPYSNSSGNSIDKNLLIALLSCFVEDYDNAYLHMDKFLSNRCKVISQFIYYYAVRDYFALMSLNYTIIDIKQVLVLKYPDELVDEVLNDLRNYDDILKNFPFPECFDCANCPLNSQCIRKNLMKLEFNVQRLQKENRINQAGIRYLFDYQSGT